MRIYDALFNAVSLLGGGFVVAVFFVMWINHPLDPVAFLAVPFICLLIVLIVTDPILTHLAWRADRERIAALRRSLPSTSIGADAFKDAYRPRSAPSGMNIWTRQELDVKLRASPTPLPREKVWTMTEFEGSTYVVAGFHNEKVVAIW